VDYPFNADASLAKPGSFDRLRTQYETFRITARERRNSQDVDLTVLKGGAPLSAEDLSLVFITHNDILLLPYFLAHYRALGITRFICVDDVSSDGSREYLLNQHDVDVWSSSLRYGEARRGRNWREALFRKYGLGRWYLNVDSDEFLVYDRCFEKPLPDLVRALEKQGMKRFAAPMLDMYGGPGNSHQGPDDMPWHYSPYFDASGYTLDIDKRGISIKGGPRHRHFGEDNELMKYPLIYWDKTCHFGSSPHRPLPFGRNFVGILGALLHFKFFTNYREKIAEAAEGKQHYNGSEHYQAMMREIESAGGLDFNGEMSARYEGPQQLVDLGFIGAIEY
jgi:hypothetical protein